MGPVTILPDTGYQKSRSRARELRFAETLALEHLGKYKHRAIDILKFGIRHNTRIISEAGEDSYCICNELGGVIDSRRTDWFNCDVDDIAVYVDIEVNDDEINALIEQLPKFKKRY